MSDQDELEDDYRQHDQCEPVHCSASALHSCFGWIDLVSLILELVFFLSVTRDEPSVSGDRDLLGFAAMISESNLVGAQLRRRL